MTVSEIVKRLGGAAALADAIGLPAYGVGALRVRAWCQRNAIPGQYWAAISAYSGDSQKGVTLEVLAATHAVSMVRAA